MFREPYPKGAAFIASNVMNHGSIAVLTFKRAADERPGKFRYRSAVYLRTGWGIPLVSFWVEITKRFRQHHFLP